MSNQGANRVQLFVSAHKPVARFDCELFKTVQVGAQHSTLRFPADYRDNTGENISAKNPRYCELTTQYWVWKNQSQAEYIGFQHYRRYFNFSAKQYRENNYGEIIDDYIIPKAAVKYGLDEESILRAVQGFDIITSEFQDLRRNIDGHGTPLALYQAAPALHLKDLKKICQILCKAHPDYRVDVENYLHGNYSCFCNMFIMRQELFAQYCQWLFPLLEQFERAVDYQTYSKEALRTVGHLAERLFNIWFYHQKRLNPGLKTKALQSVHFTDPDLPAQIEPYRGKDKEMSPGVKAFSAGKVQAASSEENKSEAATSPTGKQQAGERLAQIGKDASPGDAYSGQDQGAGQLPIIPIVLAADDRYVPMVTVTIQSVIQELAAGRILDFYVFHRDISLANQAIMQQFFAAAPHRLTFVDIGRKLSGLKLSTNNQHISVETYYRFLIQDLLPFYDKVLYLDSDLLIKSDISQLFDMDLGDNYLGAIRDIDFCANLNVKITRQPKPSKSRYLKNLHRMQYAKEVLHLDNPYDYFQAGVLLLNTKLLRMRVPVSTWMRLAENPKYIYNDQDILNQVCQGHVKFLAANWNVMHECGGRVANLYPLAPAWIFEQYQQARQEIKIVHYAGFSKPWSDPNCEFGVDYWMTARNTPFYEQLLWIYSRSDGSAPPALRTQLPIGSLRKPVEVIFPDGSKRRQTVRRFTTKARGVWEQVHH